VTLLRIGHVIAGIGNLAAGPSHSVPAMCNELAALGHHVELHVIDDGGATVRNDARYELHAYPGWPVARRLGISPAMHRGLAQAARRLDLMHWHGLWMLPNVYPALAARGTNCKLVASPRGTLEGAALDRSARLKRLVWRALQGPAVARAAMLHATSEGELGSIRALGLSQPVAMVENGIYLPAEALVSSARAARGARRTLLYLGRVHPIKGLDAVVRARACLEPHFPDWDLKIVGPDAASHQKELQALASTLGCLRVSFGPPQFGDIRDRTLAAADLYVLASHSENFALSVAEALAAGLPVVCSRGAPWSGIESHGCGAWVPNTPEELERALRSQMSQSRSVLTHAGDRGRAWMHASFSWAGKARQLSESYAWALSSALPPPAWIDLPGRGPRDVPHTPMDAHAPFRSLP